MIIRHMRMEDYDAVYSLWLHTPGMGLNTTDDSREGIARFLARNPSTCLVAEEAGILRGVVMAGHDGRRGYIYHTAVSPEYRRQGIARQLVEAALAALEGEGIHKAALVAYRRNETGNAFWESQGFTTREDLVYRNRNIHPLEQISPL
ncbi:MAG: GNAT family N-acetyltransferase [Aristaeellaceae bacterium]